MSKIKVATTMLLLNFIGIITDPNAPDEARKPVVSCGVRCTADEIHSDPVDWELDGIEAKLASVRDFDVTARNSPLKPPGTIGRCSGRVTSLDEFIASEVADDSVINHHSRVYMFM